MPVYGKNLPRYDGFVAGDGVKDSSVYLDGNVLFVDVIGDAAQGPAPAFVVRGLDANTNAPTVLFRVNKDGSSTGLVGDLSASYVSSASVSAYLKGDLSASYVSSASVSAYLKGNLSASYVSTASVSGYISNTNASLTTPTLFGGTSTARDKGAEVYNVLAFGGTMNSEAAASANTFAYNLAASTARAASGGVVFIPGGIYYTNGSLPVYGGNSYRGAGQFVTMVMLASGAPSGADVFHSSTFQQNLGASANSGDCNFYFGHMMIDGNRANNSHGRHGLGICGAGYSVEEVTIRHCHGNGIWNYFKPLTNQGLEALGIGIGDHRAIFRNIQIYDCDAAYTLPAAENFGGSSTTAFWFWDGPQDSMVQNLKIYSQDSVITGQRGLHLSGDAVSIMGNNLHIYQNFDVGLDVHCSDADLSGIYVGGMNRDVLLRGNGAHLGGKINTSFSGGIGLDVQSVSGGHDLNLTVEQLGVGATYVNIGSSQLKNSFMNIVTTGDGTASGWAYAGTINATAFGAIINAGFGVVASPASYRSIGSG